MPQALSVQMETHQHIGLKASQQFQPDPRARATGEEKHKSRSMPPHLCALSLKNYLLLILKRYLGLYIYLLNRLGSLYSVKM